MPNVMVALLLLTYNVKLFLVFFGLVFSIEQCQLQKRRWHLAIVS